MLRASRIYRRVKSLKNYCEHILPVDPEGILWRNHFGIPTMTCDAENRDNITVKPRGNLLRIQPVDHVEFRTSDSEIAIQNQFRFRFRVQ